VNDKSQLEPVDRLEFLGFGVDAARFEFYITPEKLARGLSLVDSADDTLVKGGRVSLDDLQELTGFLQSQVLAAPPIRVWTRALYRISSECKKAGLADSAIDEEGVEELAMIRRILSEHNGSPIIHPGFSERYRLDAGETGWGAHSDSSALRYSSTLPTGLIGSSSTMREIYALKALLSVKGRDIAARPCFVFDSANAVRILTKGGSSNRALTAVTKDIFSLLEDLDMSPVYAWVPRSDNKEADKLSKRWDASWRLLGRSQAQIAAVWPGVPVVCIRFTRIGWLLRSRRIGGQAPIVLVVPHWPSQSWWPVLWHSGPPSFALGVAHECFLPLWAMDPCGVGKPPWRMHAE
jgi:hypothetical protein